MRRDRVSGTHRRRYKRGATHNHVEVTREQPVLEHTAVGDVDALALVRDNDDRAAQGDVAPEVHVAGDGEMVELNDLGDLLEALLELLDLYDFRQLCFPLQKLYPLHLLEVVPKLDDRRRLEHALLVDDQLAVLERVDVRLDQQQVRAALHRQEARPRNVDTMAVLEVLDRGTSGGLELDDRLTIVVHLRVDDDLELHALVLHDALDRCQNCERV